MPTRLLQVARSLPIAEHAAIGEGRAAALVASDGTLAWWCPGRFDAPSVFASLLDPARGGHFRVGPTGAAESTMRYAEDTNVLETLHATAHGKVLVVDFCPFPEDAGSEDAVLVRRVLGLEGTVEVAIEFAPRFRYGEVRPRFADTPAGLLARGAGSIMLLRGPPLAPLSPGVRGARLQVRAGEHVDLVLRHRPFDEPVPFADALEATPDLLERLTRERWATWARRTTYEGPHAAQVRRAALTLKLLQYAPNGAFVAAPTTSLPEEVGGVRNWDYRFTWLRDGALSARALHEVGHEEEARGFARWLHARIAERPEDVRIMYTVAGTDELDERELHHLDGHRGSRPVRVGNGAATQRQLDVYGEVFDFLHHCGQMPLDAASWEPLRRLADWVAEHWREPDSGIWEMRSAPRHFTLSKAMAWVALHRAAEVARAHGLPGDVARWETEAALVRADVESLGWDERARSFVQAFGQPDLDASNLLLPLVGFLDARDPRMVATVDRVLERLTVDGLVYRYLGSDDGVAGGEATFAYCTFWLIEVMALQGRVDEARALFERMLARATSLGQYAEEIDARTGEHLGNHPQGFPHAGLIQAALALQRAEAESSSRRVPVLPAWSAPRPDGP